MAAPFKKPTQRQSSFFARPAVSGTVGALLLCGLTYFLFVAPLLGEMSTGGLADVAGARLDAETKEQSAQSAQALVGSTTNIPGDGRLKVQGMVPEKPDVPLLIAEIDAIVRQSGMQTVAFDLTEPKDAIKGLPEVRPLNIAVNVMGGDYTALKTLLVGLEYSSRLFDVVGLAFNAKSATYTLNIRAYALVGAAPTVPPPIR